MSKKLNLIGQRFARLTVIAEAKTRITPSGQTHRSIVVCDCGTKFIADDRALKSGHTRSCGCLQRETVARLSHVHGHSKRQQQSGTYHTWASMIKRCTNPNDRAFRWYGAKGVTVCERWTDFRNFLADMGTKPEGKSLDRWPNNRGNYEPGNCRWATPKEQARNRRRNKIYTFSGVTGCLAELCDLFGLNYQRINMRLWKGWSPQEAFTAQKNSVYH